MAFITTMSLLLAAAAAAAAPVGAGDPSADLGHLLDLLCVSGAPAGPGCTFQPGFVFSAVSQSRADNATSWGFTVMARGEADLTYGFQEEVPGIRTVLVQLKTPEPQGEYLSNLELDPQSMVGAQIFEPSGYLSPEIQFQTGASPTSRSPALVPGATASAVFPSFWDYSTNPPQLIPQNVAFYKAWVAKNGRTFSFSQAGQQQQQQQQQKKDVGRSLYQRRREIGLSLATATTATTTTLAELMGTFAGNLSCGRARCLDRRVLVSGGAFLPGDAYFVTELMGEDVLVSPSLDINGSDLKDWLNFAHTGASNPDGAFMDVRLADIDYARIVQADPENYLTPWLQLEGPGQSGWLYVVFPLWYNYTISPPSLVAANVQFFWDWVNQNGWSFQITTNPKAQ